MLKEEAYLAVAEETPSEHFLIHKVVGIWTKLAHCHDHLVAITILMALLLGPGHHQSFLLMLE